MPPPDKPTANAPVPDGECWYKVLTNKRHITTDGISPQAFKGNAIAVVVGKPWTHEMSGRIVSLAGNQTAIEADAHARVTDTQTKYAASHNGVVASNIIFAGVACEKVTA